MLAEERYGNDPKDYIAGQIRMIEAIRAAVRYQKIPLARVDDAVRHVLTLKTAAGLFAATALDLEQARSAIGSPKNREVELKSARAAVVAPRNLDHRIPLAAEQSGRLILISPINPGRTPRS
jgi:beta-glucosidase-like glycosyl hydrolase